MDAQTFTFDEIQAANFVRAWYFRTDYACDMGRKGPKVWTSEEPRKDLKVDSVAFARFRPALRKLVDARVVRIVGNFIVPAENMRDNFDLPAC